MRLKKEEENTKNLKKKSCDYYGIITGLKRNCI